MELFKTQFQAQPPTPRIRIDTQRQVWWIGPQLSLSECLNPNSFALKLKRTA